MKKPRGPRERRHSTSAPDGMRPITGLALKSLVDTLRPEIAGQTVLDLYGGQGRVAEAFLKNGATQATVVEITKAQIQWMRKNLAFENLELVQSDVLQFLKRDSRRWDILFIDPPYESWDEELQSALVDLGLKHLKSPGTIVFKHPSTLNWSVAPPLSVWKTRPFGDTTLTYLRNP